MDKHMTWWNSFRCRRTSVSLDTQTSTFHPDGSLGSIMHQPTDEWVSPRSFCPHLLTSSAAKVLENKLKEEDGDSNGRKTEEGSNKGKRVWGLNYILNLLLPCLLDDFLLVFKSPPWSKVGTCWYRVWMDDFLLVFKCPPRPKSNKLLHRYYQNHYRQARVYI